MLTYNKFINGFNFHIIFNNEIISECNGRCVYGQNKTNYDSFIEMEFIPFPVTTRTSLKIPNNFNSIVKKNIENDINGQIIKLLNDFIVTIGGDGIDYSIIERRKSFNVFLI